MRPIGTRDRNFCREVTYSRHSLPIAPNRLERIFTPAAPNQVWTADMTYICTDEGWLYLAIVLDLFNREVVGWSIRPRMTADIVTDALAMAWFRRKPVSGLIHHSDRGSRGGFNWPSQHPIVEQILSIRPGLLQVSSNPAFSAAWYSVHWQRPGSLERSTGIGPCVLGSIVAEGR